MWYVLYLMKGTYVSYGCFLAVSAGVLMVRLDTKAPERSSLTFTFIFWVRERYVGISNFRPFLLLID